MSDRRPDPVARVWTDADIAAAAQLACLLEVLAPKPGNVAPGGAFDDMGVIDFVASAAAIGEPLRQASRQPLGRTIRAAVEATASWTRANTNLGIVLLLAPIARAAGAWREADGSAGPPTPAALRAHVHQVLAATGVEDAREVYAAIRLASPGGLGTADTEDVHADPTVPLVEAMQLAAARDDIAREYATDFSATFDLAVPSLLAARADSLAWPDAIVETFLIILAARPDTHIARRGGTDAAAEVSRLAGAALAAGGVRSAHGRRTIAAMDRTLRGPGNLRNPGTTADLTAAATFVVLLCHSGRI
jgi:triphosphoribosyl-dephospho-CoA synthase